MSGWVGVYIEPRLSVQVTATVSDLGHARSAMAEPGEFALPLNLASAAEREGREGWLRRLPQTIEDLARR